MITVCGALLLSLLLAGKGLRMRVVVSEGRRRDRWNRVEILTKGGNGQVREKERDGSETESGGDAAQPHSEPPKGVPETHEPIGVAVAATRFLPLRSDQSHRQRPRRPAPLPRVYGNGVHCKWRGL